MYLFHLWLALSAFADASDSNLSTLPRMNSRLLSTDTVKSHIARLRAQKPLNTLYIRNGTLIGDQLGFLNNTIAKRREDISIGIGSFSLDINLIEVASAAVIFAGLACVFVPSCIPALAGRLAGAGISSVSAGPSGAAVELESVVSARSLDKNLFAREDQFEVWACETDGDNNVCENGDEVTAIANAIGTFDTPSTSVLTSNAASAWQVVSSDDGSEHGFYWHCLSEGSDCALNDNGPTNQVNDGSTTG